MPGSYSRQIFSYLTVSLLTYKLASDRAIIIQLVASSAMILQVPGFITHLIAFFFSFLVIHHKLSLHFYDYALELLALIGSLPLFQRLLATRTTSLPEIAMVRTYTFFPFLFMIWAYPIVCMMNNKIQYSYSLSVQVSGNIVCIFASIFPFFYDLFSNRPPKFTLKNLLVLGFYFMVGYSAYAYSINSFYSFFLPLPFLALFVSRSAISYLLVLAAIMTNSRLVLDEPYSNVKIALESVAAACIAILTKILSILIGSLLTFNQSVESVTQEQIKRERKKSKTSHELSISYSRFIDLLSSTPATATADNTIHNTLVLFSEILTQPVLGICVGGEMWTLGFNSTDNKLLLKLNPQKVSYIKYTKEIACDSELIPPSLHLLGYEEAIVLTVKTRIKYISLIILGSDTITDLSEETISFVHRILKVLAFVIEKNRTINDTESQLSVAKTELIAQNTFLTQLSHEFRTSLTGLTGGLTLLTEACQMNYEQLEYAETVKRAGVVLLNLTEDVLSFISLQRSPRAQICTRHYFNDIIQDIVSVVSPLITTTDRFFILDIDPAIITMEVETFWDKITYVLLSLLTNSINHGKGRIILKVRYREVDVIVNVPRRRSSIILEGDDFVINASGKETFESLNPVDAALDSIRVSSGYLHMEALNIQKDMTEVITFTVEDEGSGIQQDILERLAKPHVRWSRVADSETSIGLGLPLIIQNCAVIGADLSIHSSSSGSNVQVAVGGAFTENMITLPTIKATSICISTTDPLETRIIHEALVARGVEITSKVTENTGLIVCDPLTISQFYPDTKLYHITVVHFPFDGSPAASWARSHKSSISRPFTKATLIEACNSAQLGTVKDLMEYKPEKLIKHHFSHDLSSVTTPTRHSGRVKLPNVIVVDDEKTNLLVTGRLCEKIGAIVLSCNSGESFLEETKSIITPTLVFMDLTMPGLSGIETALELKKRSNRDLFQLVALTARELTTGATEELKAAGFVDAVQKPPRLEIMRDLIGGFMMKVSHD